MKTVAIIILALFALPLKTVYDFKITAIDGGTVDLAKFKGKKILIVNTASKCGFTPQYAELEKLSQQYKDKLVVIGFPANNFGGQEPGSNSLIQEFCQQNYGVSFLMAEKVSVKGDDMDELFKYLTTADNPDFTGEIKWNFEKFLIDENGKLVHRFRSAVKPLSPEITKYL
ncbi:glutathione peroxidase [Arcticibacter tournemirensis]